jgi:hypothetical protein
MKKATFFGFVFLRLTTPPPPPPLHTSAITVSVGRYMGGRSFIQKIESANPAQLS